MPEIETLLQWRDCDVVIRELYKVSGRLLEEQAKWARALVDPTLPLGGPASPLFLADRGVIALRLHEGLWCQTYRHGWPVSAPFLVTDIGKSVGLMLAAALNPQWFNGLPYTRADVEAAIPETARPYVRVEWQEVDDIVPPCRVDPDCILARENIGKWL